MEMLERMSFITLNGTVTRKCKELLKETLPQEDVDPKFLQKHLLLEPVGYN
jgi:hypothetical protein